MDKDKMMSLMLAAVSSALAAGKAIMEIYNTDFDIEIKKDSSPLTLADRRSHEIIAAGLTETDLPFLSEEGKDIPYEERRKWEYFWLVDPLDGTKEFIKKNGEFTVNIALIYRRRPVLGVVSAPALNKTYFAAENIGSFMSAGTTLSGIKDPAILIRESLSLYVRKNKTCTVVASRSHMSRETDEYINEQKRIYGDVTLISAGSSLKFCLVAEGRADIYPRFAPTMEWDTAAGQAIIEQAGGQVIDYENGKLLSYNKENLLNPWFLCRSVQ